MPCATTPWSCKWIKFDAEHERHFEMCKWHDIHPQCVLQKTALYVALTKNCKRKSYADSKYPIPMFNERKKPLWLPVPYYSRRTMDYKLIRPVHVRWCIYSTSWQGSFQIYGHARCMHTALASSKHNRYTHGFNLKSNVYGQHVHFIRVGQNCVDTPW